MVRGRAHATGARRERTQQGVRAIGFRSKEDSCPNHQRPPSTSPTCARPSASPSARPGLAAAAKSLVRRESREIKAVDGVGFDIEPGEVVGFLGPNGAGKTTTLKMLSGLLYPTSGEATVLGYVPSKRERPFLRQITMVMGNRNQLQWDLPALDSFELIRAIYRLPEDDFKQTRDEFVELLDLGALVNKPVRNL